MHISSATSKSLFLTTALLFGSAPALAAVNHNVFVGGAGFMYTPSTLNIAAGDTVTFTNAGGFHNATSDPGAVTPFHCSVACGAAPVGNASSAAWSSIVTFPTPGVIGYHCEIHGAPGQGMFGTINVTVPVDLQSFDID